ncbi:hypothetical protein [Neotabrizicola sp. sgz301269]|uniref:hypothetical protein n=1 Tax=Neotabrizicola sp. sgz301269 TaxID=3276282 RepID=UPI0037704ED7
MSRILASRIAKLEAKRKMNDLPKVICVVGGPYMQMIEDPANPGHLIWPEPPGGFEIYARNQQSKLLRDLIDYDAQIDDEGNTNGKDTSPAPAGFTDQLAPGAKPLKFRYETDASGTEWQVEISTGQKWKV